MCAVWTVHAWKPDIEVSQCHGIMNTNEFLLYCSILTIMLLRKFCGDKHSQNMDVFTTALHQLLRESVEQEAQGCRFVCSARLGRAAWYINDQLRQQQLRLQNFTKPMEPHRHRQYLVKEDMYARWACQQQYAHVSCPTNMFHNPYAASQDNHRWEENACNAPELLWPASEVSGFRLLAVIWQK